MFKNKRYITKGVESDVALLLQLFMWQCIDELPHSKDYLQVFEFTLEDGKQKIVHIHINRSAFGSTYEEQEAVIARIVYFVEAHWNELVKFSRRNIDNIMRWASKYGIMENIKNTYDKTKKENYGRYVAVNLHNSYTVELRIFRGTLNINTFYATLQLVDEICRKAISMNDYDFERMSWSDFVSKINKDEKPELINYLKLKQLYVNDPVGTEGDV